MKKTLTPKLQKIQMQLDSISASFRRHMAAENYAQAAADAMRAHKLIPASVVPLSDAATAAVKGGLWDDAIIYAKKALQRDPKHINSLDALSHAYGGKDDWENVRIYGLQALQLRDGKIADIQAGRQKNHLLFLVRRQFRLYRTGRIECGNR